MGYYQAGFDVTGVDIALQQHYPFAFIQADALEYLAAHGREYDVIHASPPCQAYSDLAARTGREYPKLIEAVRDALERTGKPYVIENVEGAPLRTSIILCGTMFGLRVLRHRLFESNILLLQPGHTARHPLVFTLDKRKTHYGTLDQDVAFVSVNGGGHSSLENSGLAMGIDWMTMRELSQAIPPAYTRFIGKQLLEALNEKQ